MTSVRNASVGAILAGNSAFKARRSMNDSLARLSTGERTIHGFDPAGKAVASNLSTQARSSDIAARNSEDGISMLHAAENVLFELASLNYRLRELAVQKLNDTMSTADKAAIAAEEAEVKAAGNNIDLAAFNGTALLTAAISFVIDLDGTTDELGAVAAIALDTGRANADTSMAAITLAMGKMAAGISALRGHQANLYALAANSEAAASRIGDTDFARESANLAKNSILNQSAMAMVAQANQAGASVLAVLQ
jgi:flagellin